MLACFIKKEGSNTYALSSTNAHRSKQDLLVLPPALTQTSNNLSSTGASKWVAKSNSTATDVHLLVWQLELILTVHSHRSKSLVDLNDIDIIDAELELLQELWDGDGWSDTHDSWGDTSNGGTDELSKDWLAELDGSRALHQQNSGGAIGDLGRVASSRPITERHESRTNLAERLKGRSVANTFILSQKNLLLLTSRWVLNSHLDWHNLVIEPSRLLCLLGALVGLSRISILHLPGDVEILANVLGGLTHRHLAVLRILGCGQHSRVEWSLESVTGFRHQLGTDGDTDLDASLGDRVGDVLGGLQAGGTEAVDGVCACGVWDSGGEGGGADDVGGLAAVDVAESHILDHGWVNIGLLDDFLKEGVDEVVEGGVLKASLPGLGESGTAGVGDDNVVGVFGGAI